MKAILLFILSFVIFTSCGKGASLSEAELLGLERCVAERPDSVYAVLKDVETRELSPSALALYYLVRTEAEDKLYMTHTTDSLIALSHLLRNDRRRGTLGEGLVPDRPHPHRLGAVGQGNGRLPAGGGADGRVGRLGAEGEDCGVFGSRKLEK